LKSQVNIPDTNIKSTSDLAAVATELTDEDVMRIGQIVGQIQRRYISRANTPKNLEEMRDEYLTRLAEEVNVLATVDPSPCFYGEPPVLEIIGKISVSPDGFDHEKKQYEVLKANELGEDYRGQKESYKKRRLQK
jgi:hypothetical protein